MTKKLSKELKQDLKYIQTEIEITDLMTKYDKALLLGYVVREVPVKGFLVEENKHYVTFEDDELLVPFSVYTYLKDVYPERLAKEKANRAKKVTTAVKVGAIAGGLITGVAAYLLTSRGDTKVNPTKLLEDFK